MGKKSPFVVNLSTSAFQLADSFIVALLFNIFFLVSQALKWILNLFSVQMFQKIWLNLKRVVSLYKHKAKKLVNCVQPYNNGLIKPLWRDRKCFLRISQWNCFSICIFEEALVYKITNCKFSTSQSRCGWTNKIWKAKKWNQEVLKRILHS